jgi:hypothetical protein
MRLVMEPASIWLPDGRVAYRLTGVILDPAKGWKEQPLQRLPNPGRDDVCGREVLRTDASVGQLASDLIQYLSRTRQMQRIGPPEAKGWPLV